MYLFAKDKYKKMVYKICKGPINCIHKFICKYSFTLQVPRPKNKYHTETFIVPDIIIGV